MKKVILLLSVVALFVCGFLLMRQRPLQAVQQGAALEPETAARRGRPLGRQTISTRAPGEVSLPMARPPARAANPFRGVKASRPTQALLPVLQEPPPEVPLNRKTELTPAEMLQLEREAKRDRRLKGYAKSD